METVDINDYTDFYPLLNASCFDITYRSIGDEKRRFEIYVDDEGLLKEKPIVSAISSDKENILVGNLVIAKHNNEGCQIDLTDDEIDYIWKYIRTATNLDTLECYPILVDVNY